MMKDIHKVIQLQQKLETHFGIIAINSNRSEGAVPTIQIRHLSDFLNIATELHQVAEETSENGGIKELSYIREGVAIFTLMDEQDCLEYENIKNKRSNERTL